MPGPDGWCGVCRKLVPTEWTDWDEDERQRRRLMVVHYTAATSGNYLIRCDQSELPPWPTPPSLWINVPEDVYAGPQDELPSVEIPHQAGTMGMTANMHYVPSQSEDVELGPLGEYGCLDAPFED